MWKDSLGQMFMVSTPLRFSQKCFHIAVARNASIIKERQLYLWKYFCGSPDNHENHNYLAQQIFPCLWYVIMNHDGGL